MAKICFPFVAAKAIYLARKGFANCNTNEKKTGKKEGGIQVLSANRLLTVFGDYHS